MYWHQGGDVEGHQAGYPSQDCEKKQLAFWGAGDLWWWGGQGEGETGGGKMVSLSACKGRGVRGMMDDG